MFYPDFYKTFEPFLINDVCQNRARLHWCCLVDGDEESGCKTDATADLYQHHDREDHQQGAPGRRHQKRQLRLHEAPQPRPDTGQEDNGHRL